MLQCREFSWNIQSWQGKSTFVWQQKYVIALHTPSRSVSRGYTGWQLSSPLVKSPDFSLTLPGIYHEGINIYWTARGMQTGLHVLLSGSPCQSILIMSTLEYSGYVCLFRAVAQSRQTTISPTSVKFPYFPGFLGSCHPLPVLAKDTIPDHATDQVVSAAASLLVTWCHQQA